MTLVSDVVLGTQNNGGSQAQSMLIASVVAQQKVIAAQSGASSGSTNNNAAGDDKRAAVKDIRNHMSKTDARKEQVPVSDAQTRSIVEAQERAMESKKITAAFAARRDMTELLSVIRDPDDRMLPHDPDDLSV